MPWLGIYVGKIPAVAASIKELRAFSGASVKQRMEHGSKRRDLYHYLVSSNQSRPRQRIGFTDGPQSNEDIQDQEPPPLQHLIDDGILAIVAGTDTTTSAVTSLFFLIMAHPDKYAKLQEEVDRHYPLGEDASDTKHHKNMPYLQAVV